jgi:hypothetical protein
MYNKIGLYLILTALLLAAGCASILLTGVGGGIEYSLTNIAYKTVGYPISEVEAALHKSLERLGIKELSLKKTESKLEIVSETVALKIYIDLQWISNGTTKISVDARKQIILKDKATATAIIEQTEMILRHRHEPTPAYSHHSDEGSYYAP